MMSYTTVQALGQARLADLHRQAQRDTSARAARRARRARRPHFTHLAPGPVAALTRWARRPRAGAGEHVMAPVRQREPVGKTRRECPDPAERERRRARPALFASGCGSAKAEPRPGARPDANSATSIQPVSSAGGVSDEYRCF
jgi:hypothetical protein